MTRVLVTGFGPYAEERDNPSGTIAARLDGTRVGDVSFHGCVLPVSSAVVARQLSDAVAGHRPDAVIVTGVTPARSRPAIERVAINVADFPIPDVDGLVAVDTPVVAGGPAAYFTTLPLKAILARWQDAAIDAYVSNSAGTYLCNQVFYLAQHLTAGTATRSGLVHIPVPGHGAAGLSLDALEATVRLAGVVSATHVGADLPLGAGSTS